jgi:di/tricarboxylate transporter
MWVVAYSEQLIIATIFVVMLAALICQWGSPVLVFVSALLVSYGLGYLDTETLLSSAVNPGLVTLVLLMVASIALEKTQMLALLSRKLISQNYQLTLFKITGVTALFSGFLNNTAVVAALMPVIKRNGIHAPSRLFLPLSYAAILGGTLTLIGTSTNLLVNSFLIEASLPGFKLFDFLPVGLTLVIVCGLVLFVASCFLPGYKESHNLLDSYVIDAKITPGSNLAGKSVLDNGLRSLDSLFLVEIERNGQLISPVNPQDVLLEGDHLVFAGDISKVSMLSQFDGLKVFADNHDLIKSNLTEVIVSPEAPIVGRTIKQVSFRSLFDAAVVGIRRNGERLSGRLGKITLRPGDNLVLAVGPDFHGRNNISKNFFVVSGIEVDRHLTTRQEWIAIGGFVAVIGLTALDIGSLLKNLLFFIAALVVFGVLPINEIKRRFPFEIWVIIASALGLAAVLDGSGLPQMLSEVVRDNAANGIWIAFAGVFISTWLLTEFVTNNAAAALMFPLAFGLATAFEVSYTPFVMAVAYGASASFILPYGYQTNLMVFNAGRYRQRDFLKMGIPLAIAYIATSLTAIPYFFPFN